MGKFLAVSGALFILLAGLAHADDAVSCKGTITSKQGEGLVHQSFRFEIAEVTGNDLRDVLDKCKKIVQQKQNKAGRANPAMAFRKFSDLDLTCSKGAEKFQVRHAMQTSP